MITKDRRNLRRVLAAAMLAVLVLSGASYAAEEQTEQQTETEQHEVAGPEYRPDLLTESGDESGIETEALQDAETAPEETEAEDPAEETEAETAGELSGFADVSAFLADIGAAVNDRNALSESYTEAELRMMTNDEIAEANQACCESERWLMDRYKDAQFGSRNVDYLCSQYLTGLQNQYDAYASWKEKGDIDAYNELWEAGFAKRACVAAELQQYYGVQFTDITAMKEKAKELESLDMPDGKNKVSEETARRIQEQLNTLRLPVGEVDGDCGYRTLQMVRRFQKLYGYSPADGIIDEELLSQLQDEVDKITPPEETETEAETEAETQDAAGDGEKG